MFENTRRLETGRLGAKVQSRFLFSLFLFLVNVFQSKQELTHMRKEQTSTQYLRGGILLVASDGPTTLGDFTTFTARIQHTQWPSTSHALWWIIVIPKEKFYSCKTASNGTSTLQYRKWHISGEKQVKVCVTSRRYCNRFYKQKKPYEGFKCLLKNTTTVLVTDSINLDLEVWQNTTDPKQAAKSFFVGNVQMQAIIHGHLFNGQNVNYTWNFGDNKTITSHLPSHNHTYREDKMYLLSVTARSYVKGRFYYGSAAARLTFKVNLDAQLVAYGRRGTKLTPTKPSRDTYYLAPGEIKFVVEYKNAFSLVNSVSTDWKIDGYQIQNWSSNEFTYNVSQIGWHTVWVTYRFHTAHHEYSGSQNIYLDIKDSINLDLEVWQNTTDPKQAAKSFFVGNVQMQAIIHGHLFNGQNVNYTWNFGDNKTITSHLPSHNHTYREDKMYLLSVTARSYVKGRLYYGSAAARLTFKVNLDAQLVAYGRRGTKLTPTKPLRDTYSLAPDEIKFVVEYKNAFSLVNSVSTDWKIDGYQIQNLSSNEFTYNVSQIGLHTVWVTYRFHTAHHEYSGSQNISLDIKEPIVDLKVSHTPNYKRKSPTIFHITCQGSVPISFCWLIAKNCKLPENSSCIPTVESNRCHTTVNHTFSNPGSYCLNVSVFNTVSSKATSFGIKIPEGHHAEPSKSSGSITAAVLIPLFLCIFIVAGFVYLVKHYVERSRKTVEKADFDFRDEDCRSISSVNLGTTFSSCYHVFDICGRKKNKQNVLILNCRGSQYGSVNNDL